VAEKYPNGKPKVIRTYNPLSIVTPENLRRQQTFYFNGNKESDGYYRDGLLHGTYEDYWHNGQKKSHGRYEKGKKEGEWEFYYNQFTLSSKGLFKHDKQEGPWNSYWENGSLKSQGAFAAGKEIGTWKEWNAKGEPLTENSCFESNPEGRFTSYHANKTVKEDYLCRSGVPAGDYLKKDPDGTTIERGRFDAMGRKDSTWEAFHTNGKPASLKHYRGGVENDSSFAWDDKGRMVERAHFDSGTGERLAYDSLGHLVERRNFVDGKADGASWTYYPNGAKRALIDYQDGRPLDMRKWHPNGKPMAEGVFADGHRSGEWKDWWENGNLKEISHFLDGALHGERMFYDEKGKLMRTMRYEHGFPAEGKIPKGLGGAVKPKAATEETPTDSTGGAGIPNPGARDSEPSDSLRHPRGKADSAARMKVIPQ
jgi:uncharacterized protein